MASTAAAPSQEVVRFHHTPIVALGDEVLKRFSIVFNANVLSGYSYDEAVSEIAKLFEAHRTVGATASIVTEENYIFEVWYLDKDFAPRCCLGDIGQP